MKGKLYKENDGYSLFVDGKIFGDTRGHYLSSITNTLSPKNCQAIERGYDLDEIKRKVFDGFDGQPNSFTIVAVEQTIQIMIELMGDKKFSSGQLLNAMDLVWQWMNGENYGCKTLTEVQDKHIQSLQQTEWDVEICCEMDCQGDWDKCKNTSFECELCTNTGVPKLDATGCLILKRI